MYSKRLWLLSLCILSFIGIRLYATDNNVIVGWNDWAITNGAGTDGALDSPEHIENMMKRWKGRGFTGVYWRIEQKEGDPNAYIFSDAGLKPGTGELAAVADRLLSQFNVSEEAKNKAEAEGLEFWAWVPFIYSRGAPVTGPSGLPAGVTYDPWYGMDSYTYDHPETLFTNRSQTKARYMLSDYTDYGARISMVAWFEYFAEHYGFKNFLACMRTEDYQNYYNNDGTYYIDIAKGDEYGFNPEIVNLMLYCYDVNILTDSRFDVFSEAFDINDSMVENWRTIRGLYLTDLYRKIRQAMDVIDPNIKIGVQTPGGDYVGPTIGNIKLDWRTWINDGLIDEIVIPVALDNADDVDSGSKGYLTNARTGYGVLPVSTFRDFIDDSNNPDAKLIYAGGPYFHFTNPPAGTDGWRTDASTDAYYLSWYQRWRQLNQDIKDIGYIRFIDQDFNYFDVNDNGMAGGIGESRYNPDKFKCEGLWSTFGDGSDYKASIQNSIRHGSSGNAVKVTRSSDASTYLLGRHYSRPDRSGMFSTPDNSIFNGKCTFEFWVYRATSDSALTANLQYDSAGNYDVGIYIPSNSYVYYFSGGTWVISSQTLGVGTWQKFTYEVDVDNKTYSVYMGPNKEYTVCTDTAYTFSANTFNQICFYPSGTTGSVFYVDDVSLNWYPALCYTPLGDVTYLVDNWEEHTADASVHATSPDTGSNWQTSGSSSEFFTEHSLSFGDGPYCLATTRTASYDVLYAGSDAKLKLDPNYIVTVDIDVYPQAGHSTTFGLTETVSGPFTAWLYASTNGIWYCYDGSGYTSTGISVAYDMWTHIQLSLNCAKRTYQVVIQQLGEAPKLAGTYDWASGTQINDDVFLEIAPSGTTGEVVNFDNVNIAYTPVYLAENFESHSMDTVLKNTIPDIGNTWYSTLDANDYLVSDGVSFFNKSQCLAAKRNNGSVLYSSGGGNLVLRPEDTIRLNLDVYIPSSRSTSFGLIETTGGGAFPFWLYAVGTWRYYNGSSYTDTGVSITYDKWTHVEMVIDCSSSTFTIAVQPEVELSTVIATPSWPSGTNINDSVFFEIGSAGNNGEVCYFDNILITYEGVGKASLPSPAKNSTGVSIAPTLGWTAASGATSHDVYFDSNEANVMNATRASVCYKGNQSGDTYAPGTLAVSTTYYWRIDELGGGRGTVVGKVWSFTTAAAPGQATSPSPSIAATGVSVTPTLSWTAGGSTTSHDVYFGTNQTNVTNATHASSEYKGNQASTSYGPGTLTANTSYYWRIDEVGNGGTTKGTVWSFTTIPNAPTFVAAGAVTSGTGTITPAIPAGLSTNDILLLFIETSNQAVSISNQNGGTWTEVTNSPQYTGTAAGTTGVRLAAYWSRYNGTQGNPTVSDSGDHQMGRIIAIRGAVSTGNPWDVTAGGVEAASDTSGSIPGATTAVGNTLVVAAVAAGLPDATGTANFSSWANTNLTSVTERTDNTVTAGNGGGIGVATGVKATTGNYGNTTVTLGSSAYKAMMSIAIKP